MKKEEKNDETQELNSHSSASSQETDSGQAESQKKKGEPERDDVTTLHERAIAVLSYFGFLAIVPFYLKKDSEFCRFHGKQGMLMAIIFFMAKLFTVLGIIMDLVIVLEMILLFKMGFAALSGRWEKIPFFYDWSCQLEDALTLKTKEEELDEVGLKPDEVKKS